MRAREGGIEVCLTVALLDGLVLARYGFRHSMNHRSVMMFGRAEPVDDEDRKLAALEAFVERLTPGRWKEIRPPNAQKILPMPRK